MSEAKKTIKKDLDYYNEEVPLMLPLINDNEPYAYACVNGEDVQIMRGEQVMIKRKFALVLQDAERQRMEAMRNLRKLQDKN